MQNDQLVNIGNQETLKHYYYYIAEKGLTNLIDGADQEKEQFFPTFQGVCNERSLPPWKLELETLIESLKQKIDAQAEQITQFQKALFNIEQGKIHLQNEETPEKNQKTIQGTIKIKAKQIETQMKQITSEEKEKSKYISCKKIIETESFTKYFEKFKLAFLNDTGA